MSYWQKLKKMVEELQKPENEDAMGSLLYAIAEEIDWEGLEDPAIEVLELFRNLLDGTA